MSNFKNLSEQQKPREKLKTNDSSQLSDVELLAINLSKGTKDKSVLTLSSELIERYGSLSKVLEQSHQELITNHGIGNAKAATLCAINEIIKRQTNKNENQPNFIKTSEDVYKLLKKFSNEKQENFIVINLDTRGGVINYKVLYKGTVDETTIHPREIFNFALTNMAKSIIISHNHPSGQVTPSQNDLKSTKKLIEISNVVGIKIIDHVIIAANDYYSMREKCDIIFI